MAFARQPLQPATRAYSWARCSGLRVWKATTRCQPFLAEQRPRLPRRQDELAVLRVLRLRQHADLAADQLSFAGRSSPCGRRGGRCARCRRRLDVLRLVPGVHVAHGERADEFRRFVDQADRLAGLERRGLGSVDRERDRNRPGVFLAVVDDDFVVEDLIRIGAGPSGRSAG